MKFTAEICDTETIFIDTVVKLPRLAQHSTKKLSLMQRRILNGNLQVHRRTFRERPPKMQTLRRSLTRIEQQGSSSKKRRFGHIRIYERLFVAYNYAMCISMFLLKFFLNSKSHFSQSKHRNQRIRQEGVAFKRPKKWSRSLTGGGRLLEVPTVRLRLGNCSCFG